MTNSIIVANNKFKIKNINISNIILKNPKHNDVDV